MTNFFDASAQPIEVTAEELLSYRLGLGIYQELRSIDEGININLVIAGLRDAAERRGLTH